MNAIKEQRSVVIEEASSGPRSTRRPTSLFEIGERLCDRFEIVRLIGWGGMGEVFEAHDRVLGRRVAIKAARPEADAIGLLEEARMLAAIRHPGIVTVFELGTQRDVTFMVMELILGVDLWSHLTSRVRVGGCLSVAEVLEMLIPVADALSCLHEAGLAHCDVKSPNIMKAARGRMVLTDFGIARHDGLAIRARGTPQYMAPELVVSTLDHVHADLVDVYAFGVLAFEMLVGRTPFEGFELREMLQHHLSVVPLPVATFRSDVPPKLSQLVAELLEKDPFARPQPMASVVHRLRAIAAP